MKYRDDHSQHFLQDMAVVKELIGHSDIKKSDTVLDIGAGSGIIASSLASRVTSVIAVENEPGAIKKLRANTAPYDNVVVIEQDILDFTLPTTPYKVFSNIPFHMSSEILRKLTESKQPAETIYLILQKQFARKLLLESDYFHGMLGAQIAPLFIARIRKPLKRSDYWPPPKVETVLVELKLRKEYLLPFNVMPAYRSFVEKSFHDPIFFAATRIDAVKKEKPSQFATDDWIRTFTSQPHRKRS